MTSPVLVRCCCKLSSLAAASSCPPANPAGLELGNRGLDLPALPARSPSCHISLLCFFLSTAAVWVRQKLQKMLFNARCTTWKGKLRRVVILQTAQHRQSRAGCGCTSSTPSHLGVSTETQLLLSPKTDFFSISRSYGAGYEVLCQRELVEDPDFVAAAHGERSGAGSSP